MTEICKTNQSFSWKEKQLSKLLCWAPNVYFHEKLFHLTDWSFFPTAIPKNLQHQQPCNTNTTSNLRESQTEIPERLSSTQRFNDLSAAGEWSHSNILFWLVLCRAPPRGSDWHDSGSPRCHRSAGQPTPSYWQDPGGCPHGLSNPGKDLWNQTRWGRRMGYRGHEGRDVISRARRWKRWAERRDRRGRLMSLTKLRETQELNLVAN